MTVKSLESWFLLISRFCIGAAFAVLIIAVLTQVLGRTFGSSPIWTEELTRYALLYIAAIGAGLSLRSGDLVNVDVLCESFGEKWSRRLRLTSTVLTAAMCLVLIVPAWRFVSIGFIQTSPAMGLQMAYVHFSVFALLAVLFIFAALRIYAMAVRGEDGRPDSMKDQS